MNTTILEHINNKTIDYLLIKEKAGYTYNNIARYRNDIFNRIFLFIKRFDKNKELYIVPEYKGTEGYYYRI